MTRLEVRQANYLTSLASWITCEYCGAPARNIWYVDKTDSNEPMCFCSIEHMRQDRVDAQGPPA